MTDTMPPKTRKKSSKSTLSSKTRATTRSTLRSRKPTGGTKKESSQSTSSKSNTASVASKRGSTTSTVHKKKDTSFKAKPSAKNKSRPGSSKDESAPPPSKKRKPVSTPTKRSAPSRSASSKVTQQSDQETTEHSISNKETRNQTTCDELIGELNADLIVPNEECVCTSIMDRSVIDDVDFGEEDVCHNSLPEGYEERLKYVTDIFSNSTTTTKWKEDKVHARRITLNGSDIELLQMSRRFVKKTLGMCEKRCGKAMKDLEPSDFLELFNKAELFILLKNYVNERISNQDEFTTASELFQVRRVWILKLIYQTTSTRIFSDPTWYNPINQVKSPLIATNLSCRNLVETCLISITQNLGQNHQIIVFKNGVQAINTMIYCPS